MPRSQWVPAADRLLRSSGERVSTRKRARRKAHCGSDVWVSARGNPLLVEQANAGRQLPAPSGHFRLKHSHSRPPEPCALTPTNLQRVLIAAFSGRNRLRPRCDQPVVLYNGNQIGHGDRNLRQSSGHVNRCALVAPDVVQSTKYDQKPIDKSHTRVVIVTMLV
jgi:hypothetical protein